MKNANVNNEKKLNNRDKHYFMMVIAEKDKEIYDLKWEHKKELEEKDKVIEFYRKNAERACDRKRKALRDYNRRIRLNFSWAILLIASMAIIPWFLWLIDLALKNFWLWANQ